MRMERLFLKRGWKIQFNFALERTYKTPFEKLEMNDGVITAGNLVVTYSGWTAGISAPPQDSKNIYTA